MLVPGTCTARRVPFSCARMPFSASDLKRSWLTCSPLKIWSDDDLLGDVGRLEQRAGRDLLALDLGLDDEAAGLEVGARGSGGNVLRRNPDRDELLVLLEAAPLLRNVIENEEHRDGGERDREPEVAESIRHCTTSFWSRITCLIGGLGP